MNDYIKIGFWRTSKDNIKDYNSQFPAVEDYIDVEFWEREYSSPIVNGKKIKQMVIDYLDSFPRINHQRGFSGCRICRDINGSAEKCDGKYLYPTGYTHYIKEHGVIPPADIIARAFKNKGEKTK